MRLAKLSLLTLVLGSSMLLGCEAYKNYEERKAAAKAAGQNIDYSCMNGVCVDDPAVKNPELFVVTKEACDTAEKDYEFMPIPIMDVEHESRDNGYFYALHTYTYDDDTTQSLRPFGWEPKGIIDDTLRCDEGANHVLHLKGGPFLEWGGGFGRSVRCMNGISETYKVSAPVNTANQFWVDRLKPGELRTDGITPYSTAELFTYTELLADVYCHYGDNFTNEQIEANRACGPKQTDPLALSVCPERDKKFLEDPTSISPEELPLVAMTLDLTEWEGVSFWARRGPNSQPGLRVLVGDKLTDDDISFGQFFFNPTAEPYCRRTYECGCKDQSVPCTIVTQEDVDTYNDNIVDPKWGWDILDRPSSSEMNPLKPGDGICWDREKAKRENIPIGSDRPDYQYCGRSACIHQSDSAKSLNPRVDPFIYGTECKEFTFRGSITSKFCYDPNSEFEIQRKPTEPSQTCGDHWMKSITLSQDWKLYTVPFTELLQQGWAKRSYWLNLDAISLVRLTWDRGYVDFYIDDIRFYRKKKK
jgi:hypothetical protein